ncbi:MAG: M14 family metallopeptidase [Anaerolineales bacterium]|nr:M14 family metallopeptidase [Anaerolineales bacterium]
MSTRKGLSRIVFSLWIVVILAAAGIFILIFNNAGIGSTPGSADLTNTPESTLTPSPMGTSFPSTFTPVPSTPTTIPSSPTPGIHQPQVIGVSVAGRPLEVYKFGDGPVEKMIIAGIHGGYEWNTIVLADELIDYLENHSEIVPAEQTLYFLRAFNPDGYARSTGFSGRANENNVDLNRNFPSYWLAEWPRIGCWDYIPITGGTAPASEPETRALMAFIKAHDLQAFISYHSAALGIFPGGQPLDPGSLSLAESLAAVSDYPYPPIEAGCAYTGQLIDWVSDQGIPAVDIELTNHQDSDFPENLAILSVFLDWSFSE